MTTITAEPTSVADYEAAGEASRRAQKLVAEARELDQRRRELLAEAAFQENLAGAHRALGEARRAFAKAQEIEREASEAFDAAAEREAVAARQAIDSRHLAERAAEALRRAEEKAAEPAELVELDSRAASAARVAEHAKGRLADCESETAALRRKLDWAERDTSTAQARLAAAEIAAREENVPRPPVPPAQVTFGDIAQDAMRIIARNAQRR